MVKQVVTLQLGQRANYVGTHFWNLQKQHLNSFGRDNELDPSALFHESNPRSSSLASSFLPRLQIVDASGAFGALSTDTASIRTYPTSEIAHHDACQAWSGYSQVFFRDQIPPHQLSLDLDNTSEAESHYDYNPSPDNAPLVSTTENSTRNRSVSYWSDFLSSPLHPQSCHPLTGVHHDVTDLRQFAFGADIATNTVLDDLCDNTRTFVEQCDTFGGLLMITNADDAFAGVTSSYLNPLFDELGTSTSVLLFSIHQPDRLSTKPATGALRSEFKTAIETRLAQNEAYLLSACMSHNVQYVPLSPAAAMLSSESRHKRDTLSMAAYNSLNDYQRTALSALGMHVSLSPLLTSVGLSGLLGYVRTTNAATYTCLFSNIPEHAKDVPENHDFVTWNGTINMSDTSAKINHACDQTDDQYKMRMDILVHRDRCVTTFGFPETPDGRRMRSSNLTQMKVRFRERVELPAQFPKIRDLLNRPEKAVEHEMGFDNNIYNDRFEKTNSRPNGEGTKRSQTPQEVAIAAGLIDDRTTAALAFRRLSSSFDTKWLSASNKIADKVAIDELREELISRAADLD